MRWIGIAAVVVIAILAYQFLRSDGGDQVAEQAQDTAEQAGEATQEAAEATQEAAEQAGEAVEEAADEAAETTQEATEAAQDTAEQAVEATSETAEQATEAAQDTAEQAVEATSETAEQATEAAQETVEQAAEATGEAAEQAIAALTVEGVDLGQEVSGVIASTTSALEGITDAASAEAALPTLEELGTKLDDLTGTVDQLPDDAKKVMSSMLADAVPTLQSLVDQVSGIEGVGDVVGPALTTIMAKLDTWAQQPA